MSDKEIIYNEYCAGNCPKCMSDNLQYYTPEGDRDLLFYETVLNLLYLSLFKPDINYFSFIEEDIFIF